MAQDAFSITPFGNGVPRWYLASAVPTSGDYMVGDIVFNSAPTTNGGIFAWVNVTAGSPGTFRVVALATS